MSLQSLPECTLNKIAWSMNLQHATRVGKTNKELRANMGPIKASISETNANRIQSLWWRFKLFSSNNICALLEAYTTKLAKAPELAAASLALVASFADIVKHVASPHGSFRSIPRDKFAEFASLVTYVNVRNDAQRVRLETRILHALVALAQAHRQLPADEQEIGGEIARQTALLKEKLVLIGGEGALDRFEELMDRYEAEPANV
jgi:hypothetical protein